MEEEGEEMVAEEVEEMVEEMEGEVEEMVEEVEEMAEEAEERVEEVEEVEIIRRISCEMRLTRLLLFLKSLLEYHL